MGFTTLLLSSQVGDSFAESSKSAMVRNSFPYGPWGCGSRIFFFFQNWPFWLFSSGPQIVEGDSICITCSSIYSCGFSSPGSIGKGCHLYVVLHIKTLGMCKK